MKFIWPEFHWLLLFPLFLTFFYFKISIRNKKRVVKYSGLFGEPGWAQQSGRRHILPMLFLFALFLLTFAISRPTAIVSLPSRYNTIILVMDISASMSATDVKPNRFVATKKAIEEFIADQNSTTRIGLVSFATAAAVAQKPTPMHTDVLEAMEKLQLQWGTAIGNGVLVALTTIFPDMGVDLGTADLEPRSTAPGVNGSMTNEKLRVVPPKQRVTPGSYRKAAIILLSDGEANSGPDPIDVAEIAAERGVRVYTVGIGTKEGQKLTFQGWSMRVKLDEETMKQIARKTGAEYFNATTASDLKDVYQKLNVEISVEKKSMEITALIVGLACLCAVVAAGVSLLRFNRIL